MNDVEIYTKQIPEFRRENKPLGRHITHDPRSLNFIADQATRIKTVVHKSRGLPLTQTRGSCTAEALCGALDSDPDFKAKVYHQVDADALYDQEILLYGGNPLTDDPGGTGIDVCKAAVQLKWITRYTHALGLNQALKALTLRPVITGVNWYSSFDNPDRYGRISLPDDATIRGGHEFLVDEINVGAKDVGCWNSWGRGYGYHGRFRMSWDLWSRLLHEDGDVTVPLI